MMGQTNQPAPGADGNSHPVGVDADTQTLKELVERVRHRISLASVLSAAAAAVWVGQAYVLASAVGAVLDSRLDGTGIATIAAVFMALTAIKVALEIASGTVASAASETVQWHARNRLLETVAATSPLDARRPHSGEIAAILSHHVEALAPYLLRYQPARLRVALLPVLILVAVLPISWMAALVMAVSAPIIPVFMALIGGRARSASLRRLRQIGTMNGFLLDRLQGLTTIRLFDAVERTAASLQAAGARIHSSTMSVLRIAFLSSAVLELFAALGVASVAVYVGFNLLGHITVGSYGAPLTLVQGLFVLLLAPEFYQPLRDFAAAYHDRAAALSASGEIGRILNADLKGLVGHGDRTADDRNLSVPPSVDLRAVTLRLGPTRAPVLQDVSLSISPGEHVALVGPSGCGKSMLLGIMAGLIAPSSGVIEVGGVQIDGSNADRFRRRIAWLPQRPGFVRASLKANLLLGRRDVEPDLMERAIDNLALRPVVNKLPRGTGTLLGENGEGISGGEAQRCALVRAALADADLILADEPTEHLDAATAESIIAGLLEIAQGRTLVVATHDERLMRRMHRVVDVGALQTRSRVKRLEAAE